MVDEQELAIREVDEEVRRDKMDAVWRKYGRYVIGGAVGIVLAVAGLTGWDAYIDSKESASSNTFTAAVEKAAAEGADVASIWAETRSKVDGGYKELTYLHEAAGLAEAGNLDAAIATYDELANLNGVDAAIKDLGQLLAARTEMQLNKLPEARGRLSLLAGNEGVWSLSANESLAVIDMMEGSFASAQQRFSDIAAGAATPQTMRTRASELADKLSSLAAPVEEITPSDTDTDENTVEDTTDGESQ